MGGDGGSLNNTRLELVQVRKDILGKRRKTSDEAPGDTKEANYRTCAISREPLRPPVVGCKLGYLFNKEALIHFLLERKAKNKQEELYHYTAEAFQHIKSLKDVVDCSRSFQADRESGFRLVCPITLQEASSKRRFYLLWKCGCIVSESALRETGFMKGENASSRSCPVCFSTGLTEKDLILLNPSAEEREKKRNKISSKVTARARPKPTNAGSVVPSRSSQTASEGKESQNLLSSIFVNSKTRKPEELFTGAVC